MPNYDRILSVEDGFVAVRESPFTDEQDEGATIPAIALDWSPKLAVFNVTLLSISHDGTEERLWSDSFSISKIQRRHFLLSLAFPKLKDLIPQLPKDPQGLWGYIQWTYVSPELCKELEKYFKNAFNICGWRQFSNVFFEEPVLFDDEYTISTSELKRTKLLKDVEQLSQKFQKQLVEKKNITSTDQLFEWYLTLWEKLAEVSEAEKKLLNFDCELYEEMRDISQKERNECATMFNQQSMTSSTFQNNVENFSEWEDQYVDSVKKINEFRIAHFKTSLPRLQAILKLLKDDADKFTDLEDRKETVEAKLYEFEKECLQNEIEMLSCLNQLKLLERDNARRDVLALDEDLSMPEKLNEKEILVYTKQCEILGLSCDIQDKNEKIVRLDLQKQARDVPSDMIARLKDTLSQTLTKISRKRAILRNKKKTCEAEIKKLTRKEEAKHEHYETHHAVQMKIEKRREEDEVKKDARLEEKQKTLLRLKEYKKKYPKAKDVKPPRYQPPSVRKQEQKVKTSRSLSTKDENPEQSQKYYGKSNGTTTSIETNHVTSKSNIGQAFEERPNGDPQITLPQNTALSPTAPQNNLTPPVPPGAVGPPPPPPPPLPPLPGLPPSLPGKSLPSLSAAKKQSSDSDKSPLGQPSLLSRQTLDVDTINITRSRLQKLDTSTADKKCFPSGNELTRAIQSVKLRKVVDQEKPAALSPDGAEFLKKALERMNKYTSLSFDENEDIEEQEW